MHAYVDESYERPGKEHEVYVLAALVLYDNKSQRAVSRTVTNTLKDFEQHLRTAKPASLRGLPGGRLPELKGGTGRKPRLPGLNECSELRDTFFESLVSEANFRLYVLYLDRPLAKWLPRREARKYGLLLQNIIRCAPLAPKRARLLAITLDSQDSTKPGSGGARIHDRSRHRAWIQAITSAVKHEKSQRQKLRNKLYEAQTELDGLNRPFRPPRNMSQERAELIAGMEKKVAARIEWLEREIALKKDEIKALERSPERNRKPVKVWLVRSHVDPCLQAIDVIANFCKRYSTVGKRYNTVGLTMPPYYNDRGVPLTRRQRDWFSGFNLLRSRVWWIHNPRLRKPKHGPAPTIQ
jgi:uncharacterized protein DUF3800